MGPPADPFAWPEDPGPGPAPESGSGDEVMEEDSEPNVGRLEWRRFVRLAIGEYPLRNYYIARLFFPFRSQANILVTNLRVILYTASGRGILGRSRLVHELHLDRVIGVESFIGWQFNLLFLFCGSILLILGVSPYTGLIPELSRFAGPRLSLIWYLLMAFGAMFIILSFRQLFYVIVKPMAVAEDIIVQAKRGLGGFSQRAFVFVQKPGRDARALVRDLGALILDAQNGEGSPPPPPLYPGGSGPTSMPGPDIGMPPFSSDVRGGPLPATVQSAFDAFMNDSGQEPKTEGT